MLFTLWESVGVIVSVFAWLSVLLVEWVAVGSVFAVTVEVSLPLLDSLSV